MARTRRSLRTLLRARRRRFQRVLRTGRGARVSMPGLGWWWESGLSFWRHGSRAQRKRPVGWRPDRKEWYF